MGSNGECLYGCVCVLFGRCLRDGQREDEVRAKRGGQRRQLGEGM